MRPNISEELATDVDDAVRDKVRVPPDRLTFGDRVRVLLEEYRDRGDRIDELEDAVEEREARIRQLEEEAASSSGPGVLGR